ncbi:LLM class flavin-dependent oxidoreductase [Nakamurella endophytica]|uniref:Alkanal monooxygenase n=1 Tax=Nakamurella endophytica TaxID=1748367 RepID=A0A917WHW2_9ACTN|nr:LLM class flavin-dependent oxidoreductase [Nakamurella endophytica]GGM07612.1 alkanal monooxygenase [Nakamurella endophytica]
MQKSIGFLTFGHWRGVQGSQTRTAADALLQTVELAEAAEELGLDGAFTRVHHFERQLASPFPLLAAIGARTRRIELGTAVIDMRYENPLYMAEEAAATDLLAGGRLQLGVSRGSPETVLRGAEVFGYRPAAGETDADLARAKTELFLSAIKGTALGRTDPARTGFSGGLAVQPQSPGLAERIWWGSGTRGTAQWAARMGMNLQSSTLLSEDTGVPFDRLQAEQIRLYRQAWAEAGREREPRVSVSRSVLPITEDIDRMLFGEHGQDDQIGLLEGVRSRFGRTYVGEPDRIAAELAEDEAVREADTVLFTVPNQLGVDYNARILGTIAREIAPAFGWRRDAVRIGDAGRA